MSDPSRLHAAAIAAILNAALPASVDVYVAKVDKADADLTYPYVVIWPPPARRPLDSLAGWTGGTVTTRTQITGAGTSDDEVLASLDRAAEALHGVTPTIAGRTCGQIQQADEQPNPITVDPTVKTTGTDPGRDIYMGFIIVQLSSCTV